MSICDLFLDEHEHQGPCGNPEHQAALARRREGAPEWYPIERGQDAGGSRDFLDGKPIHCGNVLELQSIEYRHDDYGQYILRLRTGTIVSYELGLPGGLERQIVIHAGIGGHEFTTPHHQGMRFRWPARRA